MNQIIEKYNPKIIQESPRYIWTVKDQQNNDLFLCDYKDDNLVIRMRNIYGAVVFNKQVTADKIQSSIDFCLGYFAAYSNI